MKKQLLSFAVMLSATLFTACMNNDHTPGRYLVPIANGVYVVGSGNDYAGKPGCLTYFDYMTKTATKDIFSQNNNVSLGNGVLNDVIRYGDKTYIVADGENTVFVTDAKTLRIIHRINMIDLLGEKGAHPRRITADDNKIYVTTYGGYVAAIDTVNFSLYKSYEVGHYPEGIMVSGGYMYVANSDFGNGNASISVVNLVSGEGKELKNENIRNPQEIALAGTDIYYLDYGLYGEAPDYIQSNAGVYRYRMSDNKVDLIIPDATGMTGYGSSIYTYNNANGVDKMTFSAYNVRTNTTTTFTPDGIEIPAAIAIDPLTGYLFIASNYKLADSQYADYTSDGYVVIYDPNTMKKLDKFECGVGPTRISFNNSLEYIEY